MTEFRLAVGGDVQAKGGSYIVRQEIDQALYEACKAHEFAYVLACRQIGKSSLKNAVAERVIAEGVRVARLDLNRIGQEANSPDDWYFNVLDELANHLALSVDAEAWWDEQSDKLTMTRRFLRFFDDLVLPQIAQDIVIFIDEIDMTLGLPFTDDFFAAIRSMHNDRAHNPAYHRLTFVLLGVATPDELISDRNRTPFNIGRPITMRDFTLAECAPFQAALATKQGDGYFEAIYAWTNGHPYLTQKLCQEVMAALPATDAALVDRLVQKTFLTEEERTEDNLRFVQDRILGDPQVRPMLQIYQQILQGKAVPDEEKSIPKNRLKLYGLVVAKGKWLKPRNRLYTTLFDGAWVRKNMPPLLDNRYKWVSAALATILLVVVGYIQYGQFVENKKNSCINLADWVSYYSFINNESKIIYIRSINVFSTTINNPILTVETCTSAIWWNPNNVNLYTIRAQAYRESNNLTMALADYNKAILLTPNDTYIYYQRSNTHFEINNFEQAIVDYSKIIQFNPSIVFVKSSVNVSEIKVDLTNTIYLQRGDAYIKIGNYEKALADYEKSLEFISTTHSDYEKTRSKIDELKARLQESK